MKKFNKNEELNNSTKRSIIGSLLSEISWEGKKVAQYREGGAGLENVLTTEVLQILYFLPRTHFLGEIVHNLHTNNKMVKEKLYQEIEESEFNLFPGNYYLLNEPITHQMGIAVQPDALLITKSVYALIEVKRIKRSSFQKEQLSKEFYLCTREAKEKTPILVLLTSNEPPFAVQGEGRVDPNNYIKETLPNVYKRTDSYHLSLNEIVDLVDNHTAWITWFELKQIIKQQMNTYETDSKSERLSIERLCNELVAAIDRHS